MNGGKVLMNRQNRPTLIRDYSSPIIHEFSIPNISEVLGNSNRGFKNGNDWLIVRGRTFHVYSSARIGLK